MTMTTFIDSSSDYPDDVSLDLIDISGPHLHAFQFLQDACTVATDWIQVSHEEASRLARTGEHEIIIVASIPRRSDEQSGTGTHETALAVFRATGETVASEAWSQCIGSDCAAVFSPLEVNAFWYYAAVAGK